MIVSLVLQFLFVANSLIAGTNDCAKFSIPIILLNSSSPLNRFNLTSGLSSRSKLRNTPTICSLVLNFPTNGQRKRILSASAAKFWALFHKSQQLTSNILKTISWDRFQQTANLLHNLIRMNHFAKVGKSRDCSCSHLALSILQKFYIIRKQMSLDVLAPHSHPNLDNFVSN